MTNMESYPIIIEVYVTDAVEVVSVLAVSVVVVEYMVMMKLSHQGYGGPDL